MVTRLSTRRPSLIPVEDDIWETSRGDNGKVRAVKAVVDSRRPRMLLKGSIPRGPSLIQDIPRIAELLQEGQPACILIQLADDVHTLGAKETDRILLLYLPDSTPHAVQPTWKSGAESMKNKVPEGRVELIEINDIDDITDEFIVATGKEMIDKAGSQCAPKKSVEKKTIHTLDDVSLPSYRVNASPDPESPLFVFGHGLWGRLDHFCESYEGPAGFVDLQKVIQSVPQASVVRPSLVLYDARGHGEATGWEKRGKHQFHWRALAHDMLEVAGAYRKPNERPFILGGCSMGAGTAIWAALLSPNSVAGIALICAPTMWETRKARREFIEAAAAKEEDQMKAEVIRGAGLCDMPSAEELAQLAELKIPVLIVNSRDDAVHPASSAELLRDALGPRVTMVLVDTSKELPQAFAEALTKWLPSLSGSRNSVRPSTRPSFRANA